MNIYYVTRSPFKPKEAEDCQIALQGQYSAEISIQIVENELQEILHADIDRIVRAKTLEAYRQLALPCIVEHSGLFMDALPGLPGGLGQLIWKAVGDRMCEFLRPGDPRVATARSIIGYCDGQRIRLYHGETCGRVADRARGDYKFNWDPIFIPDGSDQTYGEMGLEKKRATSPAFKAWKAFLTTEFPSGLAKDLASRANQNKR